MPATRKSAGFTGSTLTSLPSGGAEVVVAPFGAALVNTARADGRVVGLSADLGKYTDMDVFSRTFPDRFIQAGMAEQSLIGMAAGLARTGFIPFATTYCVFATRRAYARRSPRGDTVHTQQRLHRLHR